ILPLESHQILTVPDVVTLLGYDNVTGVLYINPDVGTALNVTSRTYNKGSNGTYGFTMNGIDVFSAAGPRFPVSFSGAFEGLNFRTNLMLTDVSGRGSDVAATAASPNGSSANGAVTFVGPESGQTQINGLWQFVG